MTLLISSTFCHPEGTRWLCFHALFTKPMKLQERCLAKVLMALFSNTTGNKDNCWAPTKWAADMLQKGVQLSYGSYKKSWADHLEESPTPTLLLHVVLASQIMVPFLRGRDRETSIESVKVQLLCTYLKGRLCSQAKGKMRTRC